jgi:hypothetical protein
METGSLEVTKVILSLADTIVAGGVVGEGSATGVASAALVGVGSAIATVAVGSGGA